MDKFDEESDEIIQQKITKVNGEMGFKKYLKGKLLGKGLFFRLIQGDSPNVMKAPTWKPNKKMLSR